MNGWNEKHKIALFIQRTERERGGKKEKRDLGD